MGASLTAVTGCATISPVSARTRYRELCAKVDGFFARVQARHGDEMACRAGCDACCHAHLSVTAVEAAEIRDALLALSAETRDRLATRAAADPQDRCPALELDGRCAVYEVRPLVCRSHGLPIKMASRRGLPVLNACEKNFTARGPEAADPDCVLDQTTLSLTLGAVDAEYARETGASPRGRLALAGVLTEATRAR
jgi:hypothetical protein